MDRAINGAHGGLLQRVADRASRDESALPPALPTGAITVAEGTLGFRLHPLLSDLYTTVADGGFGPGYKLLGLVDRSTSDVDRSAVDEYVTFRQPDPDDPGWFWPQGVLPVLHWGCGMYACVDCRSDGGAVLMFEPNGMGIGDDWAGAWYVDAPGIAVWLTRWLDGSGWYEQHNHDSDRDMPRWSPPQSRRR